LIEIFSNKGFSPNCMVILAVEIIGMYLEFSDGERLGVLRQDQFAFEDFRVVDAVIMGHEKLWKIKAERDRIYALPEMSEKDGVKVAELEMEFAEMDGYIPGKVFSAP
jgi:ATPase subunit of ABC transporter with duplicated ATPase domains